jgi:hypothetical protein
MSDNNSMEMRNKNPKGPYYGMFSNRGNAKVQKVVDAARSERMKWRDVELMLYELSKDRKYPEAWDTAVRDAVYIELMETNDYALSGRIL